MTVWHEDRDLTVDTVMKRWPVTIRVFLDRHMLCVGCPIAVFHSLADVCAIYELDEDAFLAELTAAIEAGGEFGAKQDR